MGESDSSCTFTPLKSRRRAGHATRRRTSLEPCRSADGTPAAEPTWTLSLTPSCVPRGAAGPADTWDFARIARHSTAHRMVLRDFTAESRPFPVPTLAALVPSYYPTHFPQAMTSKELYNLEDVDIPLTDSIDSVLAECPPIQNEPVDLSVNKKSSNPSSPSMSPRLLRLSFPSPASSPPSSCIDLRLPNSKHLTAPGDVEVLRSPKLPAINFTPQPKGMKAKHGKKGIPP
ncbi:uncharacterized protein CEXT_187602 [Caerostris extrusa]|uniref:Uncharacterized protein n=1 Tax=Caerostris extrusa TaxID=172846 RepID=A0AAV4WXV0_CAEEX|nr:uncharacterized protein CEXT_187602 [Caerostris extrusa]